MKYLLFYYALTSVTLGGSSGYTYSCPTDKGCLQTVDRGQGQWITELKNSKTECMDALKKRSDPTTAWCIPVNGYTNELTPY